MTKFSASQQSQLAQIGAYLREHRENQSKSLEDIAIRTYIRPQLLSGIETGNPDLLPEPIFVQGFIRRYAETLGLKGVELSQQFTVTSIPSTPRPARTTEDPESSTTRLTRIVPASQRVATNNGSSSASSPPLFSAGSASTSVPSTLPSTGGQSSTPDVDDIPLIVDDAVLAQTELSAEATSGLDVSGLDAGVSENLPEVPDFNSQAETSFSSKVADFDQQNLSASASSASAPSPPTFDDGLPAAFTTEAASTEVQRVRPAVYTPEPVGVELGEDTTGPNLKPFAIGAVVIAAIAGVVVLWANVLGGDRTPDVANGEDAGDQSAQVAPNEGGEPDTEILPELPPTPVDEAPPASTAPVYVEAEAIEAAYVSVQSDGVTIYEDIMEPGDTLLWEAQEELDVYSGNAGGLSLSANGGPTEVLGERGQLGQRIFSAP